jgi:hypothetical protein
MPLIKNIATRKTKSGNALFTTPRKTPKSNNTWYGGSSSNVIKPKNNRAVKAKNGRVKKNTMLTVTFSPSSYGKKVKISHKPKLL